MYGSEECYASHEEAHSRQCEDVVGFVPGILKLEACSVQPKILGRCAPVSPVMLVVRAVQRTKRVSTFEGPARV